MNSTTVQAMDLTSLKAVITELRTILIPSRFEQAQQPEPGTIQIGLRTLKGLKWLELSWNADAPRIVQIQSPLKTGTESTLAKQVHHGLNKMALIDIKQKGFERVVEFGLAKRPTEAIQKTLVIELMGRHSNILLLDQQKKIITIGKQIRSHQSRIRPIGTGDLYVAPPSLKGIVPKSKESFEAWKARLCLLPINLKKALMGTYQGVSPSLALQLAHDDEQLAKRLLELPVQDLSEDQWTNLFKRWLHWLRNLESEKLQLSFAGPTDFNLWNNEVNLTISPKEISLTLGRYYRDRLNNKKLAAQVRELESKLIKLKENENKYIKEQKDLLSKTAEINTLQKQANSLLSSLSPSKEIISQAQSLYTKAKKLRRSSPILKKRIFYHEQQLMIIEESEVFLESLRPSKWEESTEKLKALNELRNELEDSHVSSNRKAKYVSQIRVTNPTPLKLTSPGGLEIQIGRNQRQNEWISLEKSRKGDLWFHAQECPGSHVVLKASNGIANDEDIQTSLDLAAFFSRAKNNKKVPVIMVETKNLQRISGASQGTVRHHGSKVLWGVPSRGMEFINV